MEKNYMSDRNNGHSNGTIARLWTEARIYVCVALALIFNLATATYTHAGMEALEGRHPLITIPFCFALTVIKLIYEKEFCANLFSPRPRKYFFTFLGFVGCFAAASFFNLLNIVHTQSGTFSKAVARNENLARWHADTEAVSKATARLKAAIAQAIGKNEVARREAKTNPATPSTVLDAMQQERKIVTQADALAKAIVSPPIAMPEDENTASRLLTSAVSQLRNAAALLPAPIAAGVGEIQLSTPKASDDSILSQLGQLFNQGFGSYSKPLFTAICLELFSVLAMIAGFAGLTWSDRIEGFKTTMCETFRSVTRNSNQLSIPFVVSGTTTRGALILSGKGPVSYPELVRAVHAAAGFLPAPAVAMYKANGELLDPDREVLTQLAGTELIVEVEDR